MLRRAADTAMYRIKAGAKGGAALFDIDMGRDMSVRMAQEQRLRLAVRDGRFCCAFQPKVDIRTQEIVGVEALIRLRDEDGVIQPPGEFIGLAAELGLINDLTYLALGQIVRSMDLIDEAFGPQATISINVAAKQAGDPQFMRGFCEELDASELRQPFHRRSHRRRLRRQGPVPDPCVADAARDRRARLDRRFRHRLFVACVLADITADEIKIDRSFITDIHKRTRSQSVLKAIEALSEPLGMTMIAEGVETYRRGGISAGRHPNPLCARFLLFQAVVHGRSDAGPAAASAIPAASARRASARWPAASGSAAASGARDRPAPRHVKPGDALANVGCS